MLKDKKGLSGGAITMLVMGIAGLVIATIIALVVVSTMTDANLLESTRDALTVTNETGAYLNGTAYTLAGASNKYVSGSFTLTALYNATDATAIGLGNATVSAAGVMTNLTAVSYGNVSVSYTYTLQSNEELSEGYLAGNMTAGVDNVSPQIPIALTIAAVVLILTILGIMMMVWQRMQTGSSV